MDERGAMMSVMTTTLKSMERTVLNMRVNLVLKGEIVNTVS